MQQVLSLQYLSCLSLNTLGVHTPLFAGYVNSDAGFICKVPPFRKHEHMQAIKHICELAECLATSSISFATCGRMWDASVPIHQEDDPHTQVALVHYVDTQGQYFVSRTAQPQRLKRRQPPDPDVIIDPSGSFSIDLDGNIVDYHRVDDPLHDQDEEAGVRRKRVDIRRSAKSTGTTDVLTFFWPLDPSLAEMQPSVIKNAEGPLYDLLQLASFKASLRTPEITWADEDVRDEAARLIHLIEQQGGKFLFLNPMLVTAIAQRIDRMRQTQEAA